MVSKKDESPKPTAADYTAPSFGENPVYGVQDKNGYIGVSPEYANYANATDAPMNPEPGDAEDEDYSVDDEHSADAAESDSGE